VSNATIRNLPFNPFLIGSLERLCARQAEEGFAFLRVVPAIPTESYAVFTRPATDDAERDYEERAGDAFTMTVNVELDVPHPGYRSMGGPHTTDTLLAWLRGLIGNSPPRGVFATVNLNDTDEVPF
jgi:hypothetical protein